MLLPPHRPARRVLRAPPVRGTSSALCSSGPINVPSAQGLVRSAEQNRLESSPFPSLSHLLQALLVQGQLVMLESAGHVREDVHVCYGLFVAPKLLCRSPNPHRAGVCCGGPLGGK